MSSRRDAIWARSRLSPGAARDQIVELVGRRRRRRSKNATDTIGRRTKRRFSAQRRRDLAVVLLYGFVLSQFCADESRHRQGRGQGLGDSSQLRLGIMPRDDPAWATENTADEPLIVRIIDFFPGRLDVDS